MLGKPELATIRAALRFWIDEIVPHGAEAAKPYFDDSHAELLSAQQSTELLHRFDGSAVRYLKVVGGEPVSPFLSDPSEAGADDSLVTVIGQIDPPVTG